MAPVLIVVPNVLGEETSGMVLVQDHDVVEKFCPQAGDPSFGDSVLPRSPVSGTSGT
jgi:hypothetical protein